MLLYINKSNIKQWFNQPDLWKNNEVTCLVCEDLTWASAKKFFRGIFFEAIQALHLTRIGTSDNLICLANVFLNISTTLKELRFEDCHLKSLSSIKTLPALESLTIKKCKIPTAKTPFPKLILPKTCLNLHIEMVKLQLGKSNNLLSLVVLDQALEAFEPKNYPALKEFAWYDAPLESVNLAIWPKVKEVSVVRAGLSVLTTKFSHPIKKLVLDCNKLTRLDLTGIYNLTSLDVSHNNLQTLDGLENNKRLVHINCSFNSIGALKVYGLGELERLFCHHNNLKLLDLEGLWSLKEIKHDTKTIELKIGQPQEEEDEPKIIKGCEQLFGHSINVAVHIH